MDCFFKNRFSLRWLSVVWVLLNPIRTKRRTSRNRANTKRSHTAARKRPSHFGTFEPFVTFVAFGNFLWLESLEDAEYPLKDVQYALDQHYQAVLALYKDVAVNTANSVDTLNKLIEETYLCPSSIDYIQPLRAINAEGKWRIIVNKVESYGYKFDQHARIEECDATGKECPLVPSCYDSKCVQKNVFHRFLVFDSYDTHFPFAIENFRLPASCGCVVGAFHPPPPSTYKNHH